MGGRGGAGLRARASGALGALLALVLVVAGCSPVPGTVLPAPPIEGSSTASPADVPIERGPHTPIDEAGVLELVALLNIALREDDVEAWLAVMDLQPEAQQQQRWWFEGVQAVPMEVREIVPTAILGVDPQRGQAVQVAFRHQVSGADPVPSLEYYRWDLHRAGTREAARVVDVRGREGRRSAYPQLWDLGEVRVQESDAVVAISSPEREQEAAELMPSLQDAASATLKEFPVPGVQRMVVTLAESDQVEHLFGESEGAYDYAGFATETQAAPEVQPKKVGDPRDPDAATGRIVLDIDYALEDLDYFGETKGGSPLLRHEALHLSMLLGDLDRWGPEWAVEGAATWWEGAAETAVREDLLAWAETLAQEEDQEATWPPSDPDDFYPEDGELIDRHYVDAGLVFVFIEERYGQAAAREVATGLHRLRGFTRQAQVDAVLQEQLGVREAELRRLWEEWVLDL